MNSHTNKEEEEIAIAKRCQRENKNFMTIHFRSVIISAKKCRTTAKTLSFSKPGDETEWWYRDEEVVSFSSVHLCEVWL